MKTVIVFESMFGHRALRYGICRGAREAGAKTTQIEVRSIQPADLCGCDLLVIGAPTRAFSISRQSTREDAVRQGC